MASSKSGWFIVPFLLIACLQNFGQSGSDQKKQDVSLQLKNMMDSKKYRFLAISATSQKGRTVQLTSGYTLKLNGDSLSVDLPYYGRSYTSDYPATDLSIEFNTSQFSYAADSATKGGWNITIVPKNQPKANKIYMSVSSNGYCTVQVMSNTRQTVSFYGNMTAYDAR
jgi:hypothetical protein